MSAIRDRKPAKLSDVARRAGVSPATVSRYLNNPAVVAAETGGRIQAAIDAVRYVPNLLAGGLAMNRSKLVTVLVPDVSLSIFNATIEAMVEQLSMDGYSVMLGLAGVQDERLSALVDAALGRKADAIILTGPTRDVRIREQLRGHAVTVIETWDLPPDPIDLAVGFSHRAVGERIARFALDRGYRRPHLLSAVRGSRAMQRRDGFLDAWRAAGGAEPTEVGFDRPTRFGDGRAAFRGLKDLARAPDLVICSSDWLAQGVLVEAQAAGVGAPDDLAVIGFGNLALAAEMRPTITTIDVDGASIGLEAANLLRRRAAGEALHDVKVDVGFRLIARESA